MNANYKYKIWLYLTLLFCNVNISFGSNTSEGTVYVRELQKDTIFKIQKREVKLFAGEYFRAEVKKVNNQHNVFLFCFDTIELNMGQGTNFPKSTQVTQEDKVQLQISSMADLDNSFTLWRTNDSLFFKTNIETDTILFIFEISNTLIKVSSDTIFSYSINTDDSLYRISSKQEASKLIRLSKIMNHKTEILTSEVFPKDNRTVFVNKSKDSLYIKAPIDKNCVYNNIEIERGTIKSFKLPNNDRIKISYLSSSIPSEYQLNDIKICLKKEPTRPNIYTIIVLILFAIFMFFPLIIDIFKQNKSMKDFKDVQGKTQEKKGNNGDLSFAEKEKEEEQYPNIDENLEEEILEDKQLKEQQNEINRLNDTIQEKEQIIEDLNRGNIESNKNIETLKKEKNELLKQLEQEQKTVEGLKKETKSIKSKCEKEFNKERNNLNHQIANKQKVVDDVTKQMNDIAKQLSATSQKLQITNEQLVGANKKIDQLNLDQEKYTKEINIILSAQSYAIKTKTLIELGNTVISDIYKLSKQINTDTKQIYFVNKSLTKYMNSIASINFPLVLSEVLLCAEHGMVSSKSKLVNISSSSNKENATILYFYNLFLEKYINALMILNESIIGLDHLAGIDKNLLNIFLSYRKEFLSLLKELRIGIKYIPLLESSINNNDIDVVNIITLKNDDITSKSIIEIDSYIVYLLDGRKSDEKIKVKIKE